MTRRLKKFYREYAEWLNNGAPEHSIFSRDCGLCGALHAWRKNGETEINFEMTLQFINKRMCKMIPFNNSQRSYFDESDAGTCHLNEARRKWVFEHAGNKNYAY